MDHTSPELSTALKAWLNALLITPINSFTSLRDPTPLCTILNTHVDPNYFPTPTISDDTSTWIPRWQNLRTLERDVTTFIAQECGKLPRLRVALNADLKALAQEGDEREAIKLVKCVLLAAMYSPSSNMKMVGILQQLGRNVATPIAGFFAEMEEMDEIMQAEEVATGTLGSEVEDENEDDDDDDGNGLTKKDKEFKRDPELEREEQLIKVLQEKKKLEARLQDALSELDDEKTKIITLEDEVAESRYILDKGRGKGVNKQDLAQFNQRADRDKEYIEELEAELSNARTILDQQEKQLDKFKSDSKGKQELRDELQLITAERDELRQKSKANENLKKKIQALQEQEKANHSLNHDVQMMQEQIQDHEALRDRCTALEKANEENAQTIANGEQEIFDQKTARRMLEHELKVITQKWEQSKELLHNAQETIRDLEDRVGSSGYDEDGNLADELDEDEKKPTVQPTARKPKESISAADSVALRQNLSIANATVTRLQHRCIDLLQENLGLKAVIDNPNTIDPSVSQSSNEAGPEAHPFTHQTKRLEAMTNELTQTRSRLATVLGQLTDMKRSLSPDPNVSYNYPETMEAQAQVSHLTISLLDNTALLRHALLGVSALQREDAAVRATREFQLVKTQLGRILEGVPDVTSRDGVVKAVASAIADRVESVRGGLAERTKILEGLSKEVEGLRTEVGQLRKRRATIQPPQAQQSSAPLSTPANGSEDKLLRAQYSRLQRENKLMTSAWYDMTCRLQSNTVHLARRAEGGRSWIGRMRFAVNR